MNNININQNKPSSIDKLSAQNQLYGDAKKRLGIYLILSIPVMIILNVLIKPLVFNYLKIDLTDSIALYAIVLAFYELIYLKNYILSLKQKAAKIQEDFDCTVYDMKWNELLCGSKECDLQIKKSSDKYTSKGKDRDKLINWYTPDIEQVSYIESIFLCQKENLGWDIEQRVKFNNFIFSISSIVFMSSLIASFYLEISIKTLILSVIIPSWPITSFAITNYFENKEAIEEKTNLKTAVDKVENIVNPTIEYARNIQDLIYTNRKNNCLIFDWFYTYYRDTNQDGISYATKQLVQRLF